MFFCAAFSRDCLRLLIAQGCLLLATEEIWDGPFHQSVILVLSHDHDLGTVGLILNRPGQQRLLSLAGLKTELVEVFAESLVTIMLYPV